MDNDVHVAELVIEGKLLILDPGSLEKFSASEDSALSHVLRQILDVDERTSDNTVAAFANYI